MAELAVTFAGIRSPNPFWLASAPPTNTGDQVMRAFDAGWGGAVWKTLGEPIVNVSSRYAAVGVGTARVAGFGNIELITDRPLDVNLAELREVKRRYPHHAVIASIMAAPTAAAWQELVKQVEDSGCDGLELNFGCPHGMSERGMGSAVGQVPEQARRVTEWVKQVARTPVLVKLTPNVTDVTHVARAVRAGGADGISLINTINSLLGVDLDTFTPRPDVGGRSSHGGYSGAAVKPIALHMAAEVARDAEVGLPISAMGGIETWRDAAEFLLLGATTVQVCTAVMKHGFRIVEDLIDGLATYLDEKGLRTLGEIRGRALPAITRWESLDLSYRVVAEVDQARCIGCGVCYVACHDGAHQAIAARAEHGRTRVDILKDRCVGCNLCSLVCPVEGCVTMRRESVGGPPITWRLAKDDPEMRARLGAGRH